MVELVFTGWKSVEPGSTQDSIVLVCAFVAVVEAGKFGKLLKLPH
jgi:hypothetical protein